MESVVMSPSFISDIINFLTLFILAWQETFFFLAVPRGMRDLSSPTRDQTHATCSESMES